MTDAGVEQVFATYPDDVQTKFQHLRQLILHSAEGEGVEVLNECLRWGEPAYLCKGGSTVRLGWKVSSAEQYSLLFHCQTRLLETFRELYSDSLVFDGSRAIVFSVYDAIPEDQVSHCIALALTYKKRKRLPLLGV